MKIKNKMKLTKSLKNKEIIIIFYILKFYINFFVLLFLKLIFSLFIIKN